MFFFVHFKTQKAGLALLVKFSCQREASELSKEEDLYILIMKIMEGYAYNLNILTNIYKLMCNLGFTGLFVDKVTNIEIYKYSMIHFQTHLKNEYPTKLILEFLKVALKSSCCVELFFESLNELEKAVEYDFLNILLRSFKERENDEQQKIQGIGLVAILIKNNRKFENESVNHKEFVNFVKKMADDSNGMKLSDELIDVVAELPLEEILI